MSTPRPLPRGITHVAVELASLSAARLLKRSLKVMAHELCHTFGMKHCIYFCCLMQGSNHAVEAEKKLHELCPVCLKKLFFGIEFDCVERFFALQAWVKDVVEEGDREFWEGVRRVMTVPRIMTGREDQDGPRGGLLGPSDVGPPTTTSDGPRGPLQKPCEEDFVGPYRRVFGGWADWYGRRVDAILEAGGTRST